MAKRNNISMDHLLAANHGVKVNDADIIWSCDLVGGPASRPARRWSSGVVGALDGATTTASRR
jgi:hypothetical protein